MAITTVTKALRKLYKSVTGEETNKISPTKIISDLADNYSGGGGAPFVVRFTNESGSWVADKSWNDAKQAIVSGVPLMGVVETHGEYPTVYITMPLEHTQGSITGDYIVTTNAPVPRMFTTRLDWTDSGEIICDVESYSIG